MACVIFIYKGKGERCECKNFKGISMISTPGKVLSRVMIERIQDTAVWRMGEEQCRFQK